MKRNFIPVSCIVLVALCCQIVFAFGQNPQGFFLDDFQTKSAEIPVNFEEMEKPGEPSVTVVVDFDNKITPVSKYVFGNNANIYMTQMVDQPVLLEYIRKLSPNVLRFPGGNLSSVYFWNRDKDSPPADAPAQLLNSDGVAQDAGYWYGGNTDSWTMSVDNYYAMLDQTNSTGIITVNYGYARYSTAEDPVAAAAHLAAEWVRYDNGRTKFWEVGNESNGAWQAGFRIKVSDNRDGQPEIITGELYGEHFKVFADSMRKAASEKGVEIFIGAQLLQEAPASWWNSTDRQWNNGVFLKSENLPDYYIIHSYYTPYATNSSASDILTTANKVTTEMMEFVTNAQEDAGVTVKPIALTEWNIFAEGSKQQASYINGMHATLVLGELIRNKYGFASRWDLANGWGNGNDHGMFNQGDEPGNSPKWNPRAAFYYMYYFQKYFGDHMVASTVNGSTSVSAYASSYESGESGIVIVNKGTTSQTIQVDLGNFGYGDRYYIHSLTGGTDNGEFSLKVSINDVGATYSSGGPVSFEQIPARSAVIGDGVRFTSPPRSVQYVLIEKGDNTIVSNEDTENTTLKIYPNPSDSGFVIELDRHYSALKLIDKNGRLLIDKQLSKCDNKYWIQDKLPAGIYIIELRSAGKTTRKKVIIK